MNGLAAESLAVWYSLLPYLFFGGKGECLSQKKATFVVLPLRGKCLSQEVSRERLRAVRNLSAYGARCERQISCLTREDISSHLKTKGMTTQATSTSAEELASGSYIVYATEHPEGHLRRMDGTLLRLYPAVSAPAPLTPEACTEGTDLFRQSVPLLWRHRERILSDSRMFLAPIAELNGLAYLGAFSPAPLGAYIELWTLCDAALITDERGIKHFVTRVAGSPLSGSNRCTLVSETGEVSMRSVCGFSSLWHPFRSLIRRYRTLQATAQHYTLAEVLTLLSEEG